MFRTILVPLDGSRFAEQALPWALGIARRTQSPLEIVRGHKVYALKEPAASWGPFDPEMETECRTEEQLYLNATARWLTTVSPVPLSTALVPGDPALDADGLIEHVRAGHADLIVMVTHGRHPIGRFLLGSAADQLIRHTAVPVLLLHPRDPAPDLLPEPIVENVIVPLDGSALAEQALKPAADLASLFEARCTLLSVVQPTAVLPHPASGHSALESAEEPEARAYLDRLAGRLRNQGLQVRTRVIVARHPADAILEEVKGHPDDVIALATHGRRGISRMLLGSVADKVARGAPCPVLVCKER
jgi:nucleotide-binding universal stress UspA family protein